MQYFVAHIVHIGCHMFEETVVALAQVIETGVTVSIEDEAILGTLSMTGKFIAAFFALTGQGTVLDVAELLLFGPIEHLGESLATNVAEFILGKDKMIARIDVSIVFHHAGMSTIACKDADAGRHAAPIGKGAVEEFDKDTAYVMLHPLVKDRDEEIAPLFGTNRKRSQGCLFIGHCSNPSSIGIFDNAFYNGCELEILAANFPKKLIKIERMVGICRIDHSHRIPFDLMLLEQFDASHHLAMGRAIVGGAAIVVVIFLRPID